MLAVVGVRYTIILTMRTAEILFILRPLGVVSGLLGKATQAQSQGLQSHMSRIQLEFSGYILNAVWEHTLPLTACFHTGYHIVCERVSSTEWVSPICIL